MRGWALSLPTLVVLLQGNLASATPTLGFNGVLFHEGDCTGFCGTQPIDLSFLYFDAQENGNAVGLEMARPGVPVGNGYYHVELDAPAAGAGWLQVSADLDGTGPKAIGDRIALASAVPYALEAGTVGGQTPAVIQAEVDRKIAPVQLMAAGVPVANCGLEVIANADVNHLRVTDEDGLTLSPESPCLVRLPVADDKGNNSGRVKTIAFSSDVLLIGGNGAQMSGNTFGVNWANMNVPFFLYACTQDGTSGNSAFAIGRYPVVNALPASLCTASGGKACNDPESVMLLNSTDIANWAAKPCVTVGSFRALLDGSTWYISALNWEDGIGKRTNGMTEWFSYRGRLTRAVNIDNVDSAWDGSYRLIGTSVEIGFVASFKTGSNTIESILELTQPYPSRDATTDCFYRQGAVSADKPPFPVVITNECPGYWEFHWYPTSNEAAKQFSAKFSYRIQ